MGATVAVDELVDETAPVLLTAARLGSTEELFDFLDLLTRGESVVQSVS